MTLASYRKPYTIEKFILLQSPSCNLKFIQQKTLRIPDRVWQGRILPIELFPREMGIRNEKIL